MCLVYNIVSLGKMGGNAEPFSWRSVEDELAVKYSICSSLDLENRIWVIRFTQERAPRQAFTYLKSTIETLKKSKLLKVNSKNNKNDFLLF